MFANHIGIYMTLNISDIDRFRDPFMNGLISYRNIPETCLMRRVCRMWKSAASAFLESTRIRKFLGIAEGVTTVECLKEDGVTSIEKFVKRISSEILTRHIILEMPFNPAYEFEAWKFGESEYNPRKYILPVPLEPDEEGSRHENVYQSGGVLLPWRFGTALHALAGDEDSIEERKKIMRLSTVIKQVP
jgi:hypothetical protein